MPRRMKQRVDPVLDRNWIRAGDTVQVMCGEDAGTRESPKRARVLRVIPLDAKVVLEGVNIVLKHVRKSQENPRGGRVEKEAPMAISNVSLVCSSCNSPSRRKIRVEDDGSKVRICSACGATIPLPK